MTKKDYELQAKAISLAFGAVGQSGLYDAKTALGLVATILADSLEKENPRFNRDLFLKACGVEK
jgi:hypothetical protein